ncbi:MAG: hypothetical protein QNJ97_21080 [Myxococcota bacterium]|nr:hypothetical protein [Myxococcota bacterium]
MAYKKISIVAFIGMFALIFGRPTQASAQDDFEDGDEFGEAEAESEGEAEGMDDEYDEYSDEADEEEEDYEDEDDEGGELSIGHADGLMLGKGTMQAGGTIALQIDAVKYDDDDIEGGGGGVFTFAPMAGYFIMDNLELIADIGFSVNFGDAYPFEEKNFFFDIGAKYFLMQFGAFHLYAGLLWGMDFLIYDFDDDGTTISQKINTMVISVPVGLLFALNQHVAIDLGTRFNFGFGLGDNPVAFAFSMPIGYLGVQGFFSLF